MMSTAVVPVVAVPFPLDQPEHPLRVAEVTPDLADVHVCPFLDSFPARIPRGFASCYAAPDERFRPEEPRYRRLRLESSR